ncbi:MAG: hypothetical protein LBU77_06805 [Clostridiales bacterium]|jgi:hypothetical protein|nr:hypothetical protein [Clostridiales bacterium]
MAKKFAKLIYARSVDDIPVKYAIIKENPAAFMEWYVEKYNPFRLEKLTLAGETGYLVVLPLAEDEVFSNPGKAARVLQKTVGALAEYDVAVMTAPPACETLIKSAVPVATGAHLFPFFMIQAAEKALSADGKAIRECEFLILHENDDLTELIIDCIGANVNYLTILTAQRSERLNRKAEDVFYDAGLNIRFTKSAKAAAESADVIINAARMDLKQDNRLKRGAVYFDLCGDKAAFRRLLSHRPDMRFYDGLALRYKKETLSLCELAAALFLGSASYRAIVSKRYRPELVTDVMNELAAKRVGVANLSCLGGLT